MPRIVHDKYIDYHGIKLCFNRIMCPFYYKASAFASSHVVFWKNRDFKGCPQFVFLPKGNYRSAHLP